MEFISKGKNPKIKSSTLFNDYENGGLKEIYILLMNLIKPLLCESFTERFYQYFNLVTKALYFTDSMSKLCTICSAYAVLS